mgnify:CR=1 FL=1
MMPEQLPDIIEDKAFRERAKAYATSKVKAGRVYSLETMQSIVMEAFLVGGQSAVGVGYNKSEKSYEKERAEAARLIDEMSKSIDRLHKTIDELRKR